MGIQARGFPKPVNDPASISRGEAFFLYEGGYSALAIRATEKDGRPWSVVLAHQTNHVDAEPPYLLDGEIGSLRAKLDGELVLRPIGQAQRSNNTVGGAVTVDQEGHVFIRAKNDRDGHPWVNLTTGEFVSPSHPNITYDGWELVQAHGERELVLVRHDVIPTVNIS